jgi:ATP synthase protein I
MLLSALFLGWAFLPAHRTILSGVILGLVVGLINTNYLSNKVRKLTQLVLTQENRRFSFGFLTRMCLVVLTFAVAFRLDTLSMEATICALFVPQILTIPVGIFVSLRSK